MNKTLSLYANTIVFVGVGFLVYYLIFLSLSKIYEKKITIEKLQENEKKIFLVIEQDKNQNIENIIVPIEKYIIQYTQYTTEHIDKGITDNYKLFVMIIKNTSDKNNVIQYLKNNNIYYIDQNNSHEKIKKIHQEKLFIELQLLIVLSVYISYLWYYITFYLYTQKSTILYFWHHGLQNKNIVKRTRGRLSLNIMFTFCIIFCYELIQNYPIEYQQKYLLVFLWFILIINTVRIISLRVTSNIIQIYEKSIQKRC